MLITFIAIIAGGALGGFIHSITQQTPPHHHVRLKTGRSMSRKEDKDKASKISRHDEVIEIGFWGDVIIGVGGGLTLYLITIFISSFEKFSSGKISDTLFSNYAFILSIGLIGGYAGAELMQRVVNSLFKKIDEMEKVQKSIENKIGEIDHTLKSFAGELDKFRKSIEIINYQNLGDYYLNSKQFASAISKYKEILEIEPDNEKATLNLANAYFDLFRTAKLSESCTDTEKLSAENNFRDAIDIVSEYISRHKNCARAYFNRACYNAFYGYPPEHILRDLREAVKINPDYKKSIYSEDEFKGLHSSKEFSELVGYAPVPSVPEAAEAN